MADKRWVDKVSGRWVFAPDITEALMGFALLLREDHGPLCEGVTGLRLELRSLPPDDGSSGGGSSGRRAADESA